MKTTLHFLLFFIVFNSFAQITLEHIYNNSAVTRIKLEYSGEKYYELKRATNELIFYNSDHTLWKTIVLPAPIPNPFTITNVFHVSEAKINPDANLEIIFGYYNESSFSYETKIISENGTTLLTIPNAYGASLSEIDGLPDKLITENTIKNVISKVYSIPQLTLENNYSDGNIKRIKLENSGEKYYSLDKTNNNAKIYNANHSLWKTVNLQKPTNAIYTDIDFVSETKIKPDALLEIGYTIQETVNSHITYSSKIINENNLELLTVPNSQKLVINTIKGLADKLVVELPIDFYMYNTNIYNLPSLTLEKTYESSVSRIKLENSDEKYFTDFKPLNKQLKIYNSNHTLWKTINLTDVYAGVNSINYLSETKVNTDALIEFSYSYQTGLLAEGSEISSRVINENGDVLLDAQYVRNLQINEINGLPNKIIGYYSSGGQNPSTIGLVYSLNNLSTSNFNKIDNVTMYPNPAKSFININSFSAPIIEATVYNMNGVLVKKENAQNITKIAVDKLPAGIYIVNLSDFNNQKSTHKITVSHQ
ncbi:T9SS type A sorting domain-containing protein [Flavobacterium sp.]|uniref:T9SS type A sorting domain-containing protein n=1 Tax=Flavobacterium sp. TaxID=239 RepID=UPI00286E7882|nr:T9SS type A sorting domain-containing protein [Flavobacterium sp.]